MMWSRRGRGFRVWLVVRLTPESMSWNCSAGSVGLVLSGASHGALGSDGADGRLEVETIFVGIGGHLVPQRSWTGF